MQPQANLHEHHASSGPGHEPSEIRIRGLILFGVSLVVVIGVAAFVVTSFVEYFRGQEGRLAKLRPERFADTTGQFPKPRLQGDPAKDTREFIAAEAAKLQNYGWSDPKRKVATLPIDRAIDLVLEQGLPVEKGTSKKPVPSLK